MPPVKEKSTIKDYNLLPEGSPYQLIEGELVMTPTPAVLHQMIAGNLLMTMSSFVEENGAGLALNWVGVYIDDENAVQPDLVYISKERANIIIKDDGIHGAPDLVLEILSPSTAYYDLKKKFCVYEKIGVKEYWIVDPEMESVEVYAGGGGKFLKSAELAVQGTVKSAVLDGFEMSLEDIFRR